jgi:hypothetical protein
MAAVRAIAPRVVLLLLLLSLAAATWVAHRLTETLAPASPAPQRPRRVASTAPTTRPQIGRGSRVLIVSIDGLRPDLALMAEMPNLRGLLTTASYTFWARTTDVALTLPSHASMLTGVTPARHTIDWNEDVAGERLRYPAFPTLFELAKRAGYTTALVSGKSKFVALARPGSVDWLEVPPVGVNPSDREVAALAATLISEMSPQVMAVHFGDVDRAGHAHGWASPEQFDAIAKADAALATVLAALRGGGTFEETLLIVTADHGGFYKMHGNDPRATHIPWIARGPSFRQRNDLTRVPNVTVRTEDTFATAAAFLGLTVDAGIDGKPVSVIYEPVELLQ